MRRWGLGRNVVPEADYCNSDELTPPGPEDYPLLGLYCIVGFLGLADGYVENIIFLIVVYVKLLGLQNYAFQTVSPLTLFKSEVRYAVIIIFWASTFR